MSTLYPAKELSPATALAADITSEATSLTVVDGSKLPDAPNLATIGTGETAEIVQYGAKSGTTLSSVIRGFNGTTAQGWTAGTQVARMFTGYDYESLRKPVDVMFGRVRAAGLWHAGVPISSWESPGFGAIVVASPFHLHKRTAITAIGIQVVGNPGYGYARLGIYTDADLYPGSLLLDVEIPMYPNGFKIVGISLTLDAGLYWTALFPQLAPLNVRTIVSGVPLGFLEPGNDISRVNSYYVSGISYGPLPNPYPSGGSLLMFLNGVFLQC